MNDKNLTMSFRITWSGANDWWKWVVYIDGELHSAGHDLDRRSVLCEAYRVVRDRLHQEGVSV